MAKKAIKKTDKNVEEKPKEGGSLADIQKEMVRSDEDLSSLPLELQLVTGAAKDAADSQRRGPEVWAPIWAQRCPAKPYDDGTRPKIFSWMVEPGEDPPAVCVIAQLPIPIVVHTVYYGRGTPKRGGGAYFLKEKVRCLGLTYGVDPETKVPKVLSTKQKCPLCALLGDRWSIIQVGGVVDLRKQDEPFVDRRGIRYDQPPRLLILDSDSTQRAVSDGLKERFRRGSSPIGTVFKVMRGMEKNSARVGSNWVVQLDMNVTKAQINEIYYPVDLNMAYPLLDGKKDNAFPAKKHEEILTAIMQRHVSLCIKHEPGKGFDAHAAKLLGLKLDAVDEEGGEEEGEGEGTKNPSERKLGMINIDTISTSASTSIPSSTGGITAGKLPGLTDLGDKIEDKEEEEEEEEVESKEEEAETETETETEEGESEETEEIDLEKLQKELLDKDATPISKVIEVAEEYGVKSIRDGKGKVKREATVKALIEYLENEDESGGKGEPWKE
jgi:hypothetical protein